MADLVLVQTVATLSTLPRMPGIAQRLWRMSPHEAWEVLCRRLRPSQHALPAPAWHRVQNGPLAGAELFLAPTAADTWAQMVEGTFDAYFLEALQRSKNVKGKVLWDIGSHFGYHALAFASLAGEQGRVFAFEPNPSNLARIRLHLERNPKLAARIQVESCAVSSQTGTAEFVFADQLESGLSSGSHLAQAATPHGEYQHFGRTQVATATIDDLVFQRGLLPPEVLKIDVEGAESLVLDGAKRFFQQHHPLLLIEVHHILEMFRVQQFLETHQYRAEILDEANATPGRCFLMAQ